MKKKRFLIYLADLTYTQQTISSDIMPAAIGGIASYTKKSMGDTFQFRIFKKPERLMSAMKTKIPDVIGFSNYIWNFSLSYSFARTIRKKHPHVTIVFGGPNYPFSEEEQENFLRLYPSIDYYIKGEGEIAFSQLMHILYSSQLPPKIDVDIPSVHYISNHTNKAVMPDYIDRIQNYADIPSPFCEGLLDEFFDGKFLPIVQTVRGCPFTCAYCCEGVDYYSQTTKSSKEKLRDELFYIGNRMKPLMAKGGRADLHIADSNFGMYKSDLDAGDVIKECYEKFSWPAYINVSTGKKNTNRVLAVAEKLGGRMRIAGSVQSMDDLVLSNVKRKNLSKEVIVDLALRARGIGANSYSELILALPGETRKSHFNTIRKLVDIGFNYLNLYTLMLLPGSEISSTEYRERYGLKTRYRVIPRCFGFFEYDDAAIRTGEIEEVVIATDSLSFQEYQECRKMHLIVALFYNNGLFSPLLRLIKSEGVSVYALLEKIYAYPFTGEVKEMVDGFLKETEKELWEDRESLRMFLKDNVERYIEGEFGTNLIFKYKAIGFFNMLVPLGEVVRSVLLELLSDKVGSLRNIQKQFIDEIVLYCILRGKNSINDMYKPVEMKSNFDFDSVIEKKQFQDLDKNDLYVKKKWISFELSQKQVKTNSSFINIYGTDIIGLSRILAKVNVGKLLRTPVNHFGVTG